MKAGLDRVWRLGAGLLVLLCLFATDSARGSGPAYVQAAAAAASGIADSLSLAFSAKTTAGDVILVAFDYSCKVTPASVTDSQGNAFATAGNQLTSPASDCSRVYYAKNVKGGGDTVTVTLSAQSSWLELYLTEYSGIDPNNPIDAQAGASGTAGAVSSGNATTTAAGDVIYGYCAADWNCTAGSGFATRSSLGGNLLEDRVAGSAGTYAATGTANHGWTMQMLALKPVSVTGSTPLPVITSATTASGTVGNAFSYQIAATNTPTSYGATGLPAGLSVNTGTGLISGTPTAGGTSSVTLRAANAAGTGTATLTVNITLTGPIVSLSSTSITFEEQTVGTTSAAQTFTLNNTGKGTLSVASVTVTGLDSGDFAQTDNCGSSVPASGNCTINVTFTPTLDGPRSAMISVTDDATGSPQSVSLTGTGTGEFMVLSADRTHLVNTITNQPVYMTGEDAWCLATQLSNADVVTYLTDRASRKFNVVWMALADNFYQSNAPGDYYGNVPFDSSDFTNFDATYWAHIDYVIQQAAARGITVVASPAFVGLTSSGGYLNSYLDSSDSVMTAYGAWLGNRYANYPNIIWSLGGDANYEISGLYQKINNLAVGIRSTDPNHLMTAELCPQEECGFGHSSTQDDWTAANVGTTPAPMNLNWIYDQQAYIQAGCATNYARSGAWPQLLGETWYEGTNGLTALQIREEGYWGVLSGCTLGYLFGNDAIWTMGGPYDTLGETWQSQLGSNGSVTQQHMGALMRSREFWKMVPDSNHQTLTAGYGSGSTLSVAARTSDGQTIIAYVPTGNASTITINMSMISSSSNAANSWWFNPSTGATTLIGKFATSGSRSFTPPDANDWVLVIDDANANLAAPVVN